MTVSSASIERAFSICTKAIEGKEAMSIKKLDQKIFLIYKNNNNKNIS